MPRERRNSDGSNHPLFLNEGPTYGGMASSPSTSTLSLHLSQQRPSRTIVEQLTVIIFCGSIAAILGTLMFPTIDYASGHRITRDTPTAAQATIINAAPIILGAFHLFFINFAHMDTQQLRAKLAAGFVGLAIILGIANLSVIELHHDPQMHRSSTQFLTEFNEGGVVLAALGLMAFVHWLLGGTLSSFAPPTRDNPTHEISISDNYVDLGGQSFPPTAPPAQARRAGFRTFDRGTGDASDGVYSDMDSAASAVEDNDEGADDAATAGNTSTFSAGRFAKLSG